MNYFLYALFLALPGRLLAQINGTLAPPLAARDTAATSGWTLSVLADQRTFFLGREYGDHAFSLAPSLTYSHASGFYGTLSGYYFHQSAPPHYAFTDLELGYANYLTEHWTYSLSYDRVVFTPPTSATDRLIANGLEAYTAYDLGPLHAAFDYNLFFGKSSAQIISLALSRKFKAAHWLGAAVSLAPGAEVFWGSPLALARYGGTYVTTSTSSSSGRRRQTSQTIQGQTVRLLAYELTLPLEADRGALACTLTGHYLLPRRTPDDPAAALPPGAYLSLQVDYSF